MRGTACCELSSAFSFRRNEYAKITDRSRCVNQEATKVIARLKRIAGVLGVPSRSTLGQGRVDIAALELTMIELPGVGEDGMPGQNG
jgi:hypothetical protein